MKRFPFLLLLLISFSLFAQEKKHRIVYDLVSADTADYSAVVRQFNNILKVSPEAELEVVCHGPALNMLIKDKSNVADGMESLRLRGKVSFKACANSMRRMKVEASQLLPLADIVPVAILELAERQMDGWSYIKAGH
ncbi:MAG: DsrE family protein [Chitinophagaceae bacterium]|nr:DsrE family protein [Chitinophagaceae bacterium]